MKTDIYNQSGKKLSSKIDLNDNVFSIKPNDHSIYLTVKSELAALRQGTSSSKTRSEVRGGGAKPWKQKGTGRSRIGSTRNPSRVHGAAAFGPKPRDYKLKVNRKEKVLAKKSALSIKIASKSFKVIDSLAMKTNKTKDFKSVLNNLDIENNKVIMITDENDANLYLSSRNLYNVNLVNVNSFSTYDIINSDFILFDKACIEKLNNFYK
ncbi:MAG: 50S ribosomal protein L4 [Candidatus Marinimicrobia bacterium]|nr:50S ribosomal protein L4 [Candidatus Neomarinimicrobiota bacterium]|tara:strand:+ start:725 stop:1351 length:627 start_codon:yes stop_codon:yes gene_type:complete